MTANKQFQLKRKKVNNYFKNSTNYGGFFMLFNQSVVKSKQLG